MKTKKISLEPLGMTTDHKPVYSEEQRIEIKRLQKEGYQRQAAREKRMNKWTKLCEAKTLQLLTNREEDLRALFLKYEGIARKELTDEETGYCDHRFSQFQSWQHTMIYNS